MARVAFILDRLLRRFGLSGRAVMPLIMCFGCAVPGIMATRTLTTEKERRLAIILAPFFSCGAKLPIWAAFGACLFAGAYADLIVFGVYLLGIVIAIVSAIILSATALKGDTPAFIMELPAYHAPRFRNTVAYLWDKLKHYIFKAATVILGAIIVIWFLTNFSFTFRYVPDDSASSMLGTIAHWVRWLFVPLGFGMGDTGWMFVVAAFTGLIAKEMVVATMGTFAGMEGDALEMEGADLASGAFGAMVAGMAGGWQAAIAFMAFNLLSVPCMAAVGAARGEFKSGKKLWFAIGYWMACAYVVSAVLYWGLTYWWIGLIVGLAIVGLVVFAIVKAVQKSKKSALLQANKE
jgi:ferrous iron transport protein B